MAAEFRVWNANDPSEAKAWERCWSEWPGREVYAHPGYVRLFGTEAAAPMCAAWESEDCGVLYPFLLRDLTGEPFCPPGVAPASDVITPYGYGGPFRWGDSQCIASAFWREFDGWAHRRGVISEFIRFGLFQDALLDYPGRKEEKQANVVRSLNADGDALWMDFEHKVRKNVNKAQRSGVLVEIDPHGDRLDEFLVVYTRTMERRGALDQYYFTRDFFERIRDNLSGQFAYFHALHADSVISTELVLLSDYAVYSFLGGTLEEAFDLRPNDLLKYEIILWAKRQGKRTFVLGGGYQPRDGVFRYKLAFAPRGGVAFYTGWRVLDDEMYGRLIARRADLARTSGTEWTPRPGFFPAYRG
jgi:hypothetical protein